MACWAVCIPSSGSRQMLSVKFLLWKVTAKLHRIVQWESGGEEDTVQWESGGEEDTILV